MAAKISAAGEVWNPIGATVEEGGTVEFENAEVGVPHGVEWKAGSPATPSCTGVPSVPQNKPWSGSCTFSKQGTYEFVCPLHPVTMIGHISVTGPGAPIVSDVEGTATGDESAELTGSVDPNGFDTEYFFEYGTTSSYGKTTSKVDVGAGSSPVAAAAVIPDGLTAATTYHFRLVAENSADTTAGGDRTFTTFGPPTVSTGNVSGLTETSASLLGSVDPFGHETTYWFEWGTDTSYGGKTESRSAGSEPGSRMASAPLTGLQPGTVYHYRLLAENSSGTATPGEDRILITKGGPSTPPPPGGGQQPPGGSDPGPALGPSVKARAAGKKVKVELVVLAAGAGGRLQVKLEDKGAKPRRALAGKAARAGVAAGRLALSVPLNGRAKGSLKREGKLALRVRVRFTAPSGKVTTVTKSVTVRG